MAVSGALAAFGGTGVAEVITSATPAAAAETAVGDRLWLWCHVAGSLDHAYNLPGSSRMSPAEAALYLDVPNIMMVEYLPPAEPCNAVPVPPYDPYLISFAPFKRVVWWLGGFGPVDCLQRREVAYYTKENIKAIWELAGKYKNLVGAQMDIFFFDTLDGGRACVMGQDELDHIRELLKVEQQKIEFWVSCYRQDLDYEPAPSLAKADVITYWTWHAKDLDGLEQSFARLEQAAPGKRKLLGCCMWDFGGGKPMSQSLMQKQCQIGLEWLRKGRIEGIVFRASPLCDMNIEAVEWTRRWIRQVAADQINATGRQ